MLNKLNYQKELFALGHELDPTTLAVLLVLLEFAGTETRECWPRQDTVAFRVNRDRRTVNRAIRKLKSHGFIRVYKAVRNGGRRTVYYLLPNPQLKVAKCTTQMSHIEQGYDTSVVEGTTPVGKRYDTSVVQGISKNIIKNNARADVRQNPWDKAATGAELTGKYRHPETNQWHRASEFPEHARTNNRPDLAEQVEAALTSALGDNNTEEEPTQ